MGQEDRALRGEGAQHVGGLAIDERIAAAAQRLAIHRNDRHHLRGLAGEQALGLPAQSRLEAVALQRVQQDAHGVDGRRTLQGAAERRVERIQPLLDEQDDITETFGTRQKRQNREQEEIRQRIPLPLITSRIRDLLQSIKESGERKHGILANDETP
jgi:hypothetical protein